MKSVRMAAKECAQRVEDRVRHKITEKGLDLCLAVVVVGDDPASAVYVRNKQRVCERVGIRSVTYRLDKTCSQAGINAVIDKLNHDNSVTGILVQLPLPTHMDADEVVRRIDPKKDVDGFHPINAGLLMRGEKCLTPCTAEGVIELLKFYEIDLTGKHVVIVGRSNIVSKPLAMRCIQENATVTVCHSYTRNLSEMTRQADILVSAVGKPSFITADMVRDGAVVVDVGINRLGGGRIVGDVDEGVAERASHLTPVPGGVGVMTVAMLMSNTLDARLANKH